MSRHLFLVQGSTKHIEPGLEDNPHWVDVLTSNHPLNRGYTLLPMSGRGKGSQDEFGNDGFATLAEARKELANCLKHWGDKRQYRIVQVIA